MVGMAQVWKKANGCFVTFTEGEAREIGANPGKEYEVAKAKEGIFLLIEAASKKEKQGPVENDILSAGRKHLPNVEKKEDPASDRKKTGGIDAIEQKIAGLLRKTPARDRMEGWFEKKLGKEELAKFREMLADGRVIKFKSSEVFRKALYTLPKKEAIHREAMLAFENTEKPFQDFTLEKDGFLVVKNEERAKALSEELREKIKAGEIKGTRAFTGEFFIIYTGLLISAENKVLEEMKKEKNAKLSELSEKLKLIPTLIRIALEFLKEEGQVIEKRKDLYQYIE